LKEQEKEQALQPILDAFAAAGKIPTPKITDDLKGKVLKEILKELKDKQESYTLEKIAHEYGHVIWRVKNNLKLYLIFKKLQYMHSSLQSVIDN
jgi:isoleucyl-tRNA synthetase